ncbi:MAG: hypothetical protein M1840_002134 [Geoglossum simile]|nr:MAG: hypothetical protein M1840_002134 [Geoglossum simile]
MGFWGRFFRSPEKLDDYLFLEENFPDPVEDQEMLTYVTRIRDAIENHTTFYRRDEVGAQDLDVEFESLLENLGLPDRPVPLERMGFYITNPPTRGSTMQYLMSRVLLNRIELGGDLEQTLLPPAVVEVLKAFPRPRAGVDLKDFNLAVSKWRVMTAYLLKFHVKGKIKEYVDAAEPRISELVELFDAMLRPFADSKYRSGSSGRERVSQLRHTVRLIAEFGLLRLSQPAVWSFDWSVPSISLLTTAPQIPSGSSPHKGTQKGIDAITIFPKFSRESTLDGRQLRDNERTTKREGIYMVFPRLYGAAVLDSQSRPPRSQPSLPPQSLPPPQPLPPPQLPPPPHFVSYSEPTVRTDSTYPNIHHEPRNIHFEITTNHHKSRPRRSLYRSDSEYTGAPSLRDELTVQTNPAYPDPPPPRNPVYSPEPGYTEPHPTHPGQPYQTPDPGQIINQPSKTGEKPLHLPLGSLPQKLAVHAEPGVIYSRSRDRTVAVAPSVEPSIDREYSDTSRSSTTTNQDRRSKPARSMSLSSRPEGRTQPERGTNLIDIQERDREVAGRETRIRIRRYRA